ncbi:MAG: hypothetical protein WCU88_00040 [Elusimicrobiota bacterium]|jgi:tetratricopeptide (TPR) repeat protein
MNILRRASLLALLCFASSGCTGTRPLRTDFYTPPLMPVPEQRLKAALYVPPRVRTAAAYLDTEPAPGFKGVLHAVVPTDPGYSLAVSSALSALFEVKRVAAQAEAADQDFLVTVDERFPAVIGLAFTDPKTWDSFTYYWKPGITADTHIYVSLNTDLLFLLYCYGILPGAIANPFAVKNAGNAGRETLEGIITGALNSILSDIRADKKLFDYPQTQARARAESLKGDESSIAGDAQAAFESYGNAFKDAWPNGTLHKSLRTKYLKAVGMLGSAPQVPEEAVRLAAHAQAYLHQAQDESGYSKAVAKMEEAIALAPWWADAYFNLGLMQTSMKDYARAIESLQLYLLGAPNSRDAKAVQAKIYELEVLRDSKR